MPDSGDGGAGPVRGRSRWAGLGRFVGRSTVGGVVLAGSATGFFLLTAAVTGSPGRLVGVDGVLAARLNALVAPRPPVVTGLEAVTTLGNTPVLWVVVGVLVAGLLRRRRTRSAAYVAVTGLGGLLLAPLVKELVGRLRPVVEIPVATAGGPSFPSGHALNSAVVYGLALVVAWPALGRRARIAATAATVALLAAIGATRPALGVHYLSDVVGGWLLAAAWLVITAAAFAGWRRDAGSRAGVSGRVLPARAAGARRGRPRPCLPGSRP